jgi:hypothetical protein
MVQITMASPGAVWLFGKSALPLIPMEFRSLLPEDYQNAGVIRDFEILTSSIEDSRMHFSFP